MKKENIGENGCVYGFWKTDFGAWQIANRNNSMYLIEGSSRALLIDTGYGDGDLTDIISNITKLPLIVVNTHGHYDHSSGNAFFEEVWMGEGGQEPALNAQARMKLPHPDYKINIIEDGQIFNLGDRLIESISIGAHHRSSFAFLDKTSRSLYTGDEAESGQVLLFVHGEEDLDNITVLNRHMNNMKRLRERKGEFDRLLPAHNGGPLSVDYIDEFISLAGDILSGKAHPEPTCAGYGWPVNIFGGDEALVRYTNGRVSYVLKR